MPLWVTPTILKWVGVGMTAIVLVLGAYIKGRHDVQLKFNAYRIEVASAAKAQEIRVKEVQARQQKINEDTKNAYNTQLANLRAYYSMRNGKGVGSLSPIPVSAPRVDDYSADNLPAPAILAGQCAETTLNLLMLQNWVVSQGNAQ